MSCTLTGYYQDIINIVVQEVAAVDRRPDPEAALVALDFSADSAKEGSTRCPRHLKGSCAVNDQTEACSAVSSEHERLCIDTARFDRRIRTDRITYWVPFEAALRRKDSYRRRRHGAGCRRAHEYDEVGQRRRQGEHGCPVRQLLFARGDSTRRGRARVRRPWVPLPHGSRRRSPEA